MVRNSQAALWALPDSRPHSQGELGCTRHEKCGKYAPRGDDENQARVCDTAGGSEEQAADHTVDRTEFLGEGWLPGTADTGLDNSADMHHTVVDQDVKE